MRGNGVKDDVAFAVHAGPADPEAVPEEGQSREVNRAQHQIASANTHPASTGTKWGMSHSTAVEVASAVSETS